MVIHQPRLHHLSDWSCSKEELLLFAEHAEERGKRALELADGPDAPTLDDYVPSEDACRFCAALGNCPKLTQVVHETVGMSFDDLDAEGAIKPDAEQKTEDKITLLSPVEISENMKLLNLIRLWCSATESKVSEHLHAGIDIPGYKLVIGKKGNRAWDDEGIAETKMKSMRLKQDSMYTRKLISPTGAEKLLKKAAPRRWNTLCSLVVCRDGKPTVVSSRDKRTEYIHSEVLFDDLTKTNGEK